MDSMQGGIIPSVWMNITFIFFVFKMISSLVFLPDFHLIYYFDSGCEISWEEAPFWWNFQIGVPVRETCPESTCTEAHTAGGIFYSSPLQRDRFEVITLRTVDATIGFVEKSIQTPVKCEIRGVIRYLFLKEKNLGWYLKWSKNWIWW